MPVGSFTTDRPQNKDVYPSEIIVDGISENIITNNIFIYNVANLSHTINRPPNFPRLSFEPCPVDKEYILVGNTSDPFPEFIYDQDNRRFVHYVDGIREVCRLMCPHSPGNKSTCKTLKDIIKTQDFVLNNENFSADNLNELGIFWSFNNPPKQEEIDAAVRRMEKTYTNELARMARVELDSPKDMGYAVNYVSKRAAAYFDESPSWHNTKYAKAAKKAKEEAAAVKPAPLTFKTCDDCGWNDIPEAAKKCFHCNFIFEAAEVKKAGKTAKTATA